MAVLGWLAGFAVPGWGWAQALWTLIGKPLLDPRNWLALMLVGGLAYCTGSHRGKEAERLAWEKAQLELKVKTEKANADAAARAREEATRTANAAEAEADRLEAQLKGIRDELAKAPKDGRCTGLDAPTLERMRRIIR